MAARWKQIDSEDEISALTVRLAPFAGVPPRVYVPGAWAVIVLGLLFAALVLPGLRSYGSQVTFTSSPAGAAVYVDGTYKGATPLEAFVPAGNTRIRLERAGQTIERTYDIRGRLIGSLFFPRRLTVHVVPADPSLDEAGRRGVEDFAAWALTGEASEQFQRPPVAHDLARTFWAAAALHDPTDSAEAARDRVRRNLLSHGTDTSAGDLSAALLRTAAPGAVVGPTAFRENVNFFVQLDNASPAFFRVVDEIAPAAGAAATALRESSWRDSRSRALTTAIVAASLAPDERPAPAARTIEISGVRFARVPTGRYVLGYPLQEPARAGVPVEFDEPFYIQATEVTRGQFARFLSAEPHWSPDRRRELVRAGLVDDRYLEDWPATWRAWAEVSVGNQEIAESAAMPVRFVSVYAAAAYVEWRNRTVDQSELVGLGLEGAVRFRLPTAAQWEYAAFLNSLGAPTVVSDAEAPAAAESDRRGALGAFHLSGNVWEWTSDWYSPNASALPPDYGDQRTVAGGSFATPEAAHNLLGAQPPSWTTPFLGFRLVLVGTGDG
jgi:formylglycine-generating enzyme required for sulfatase activity